MSASAPKASPAPASAAAPRPPRAPALPNPRHLKRIPAHIGPDQFERIRQAVHSLPQVVKPADYLAENSPGF